MRIAHRMARLAAGAHILDRHIDCKYCGGCIWSGMQAHLRLVSGRTEGWYCSEECLQETRKDSYEQVHN